MDKMILDWIAIDWGSSRLRVWGLSEDRVMVEAQSEDGMASLAASDFEPALLALIDGWLAPDRITPAFACGMVGSRQGWHEAPYRQVPCTPLGGTLAAVTTRDPRLKLWIAPGLSQPAPADVMRGEETQIAGFLALNPGWDGVICLPGTHSKWVHVSAGEVVSFQTFMTGEIFALLSRASVLRHCVEGWDAPAFMAGFDAGFDRPDRLIARLFSIRAEAILHDLAPAQARARLSGYLIGAELAAAKPFWLGAQVALIGAPALVQTYHTALAHLSIPTQIAPATQMTLKGLAVARALAPQESH
jgi:2-dehydro-3-deoxygalactonokinase